LPDGFVAAVVPEEKMPQRKGREESQEVGPGMVGIEGNPVKTNKIGREKRDRNNQQIKSNDEAPDKRGVGT
jgi:hypothetical protein